ncbi:hypothetical protein CDAR_184241 [Caerostris darwini]|uniref:C2H2-type domain-containing protein n=1 Tax=Caerostris darwini TaxID=1538125 RepID=A0AAV4MP94_9ARAC|nr:hypothetical protein CDAR_184241 [Caerostris darwini]
MKMSQLSQLALIVPQRYHESKMSNCATPDFESSGLQQTHIPSREDTPSASVTHETQRRPTHFCNTCSYTSVHQSTFRRHMRTHNGE